MVVQLFRQPAHAVDKQQRMRVLGKFKGFFNGDVVTITRQTPTRNLAKRHDHLGGFERANFWRAHAFFILSNRSLAGG